MSTGVALNISKAFDRVGHANLLHKLNSYGISGSYLALFFLFSTIDGFKLCWIGSLHQTIQLMLEFLKGEILVLHFSYYTLMTFVMMLSKVLLPLLMVLIYSQSVIRHLVCGNNQNWLLNLNQIYMLWTRTGSGLLISMLEKLSCFCSTSQITVVLLI